MQTDTPGGNGLSRKFPAMALLALALQYSPVPAQAQSTDQFRQPLDGMQFMAGIVKDVEESEDDKPLVDELVFRDGKFSSAVCKRYNFAEAPYWVRIGQDYIEFLAELTSPTDGTMQWKGTIRGHVLEGTMHWTKKRWYWPVKAEHRIRGELDIVVAPSSPSK